MRHAQTWRHLSFFGICLALFCAPGVPLADAATKGPWISVNGGSLSVGIDVSPNSCNPDTLSGDTWADRLVLGSVLPSTFVTASTDIPTYNPALISQAEVQSTAPQTVVYSINPKARWSDGTPIRARDFIATWDEERGQGPMIASSSVAPATGSTSSSTTTTTTSPVLKNAGPTPTATPAIEAIIPGATAQTGPTFGYRQIATLKGSNHGLTVTAIFRTPYADWQSLFNYLLPAKVLKTSGWTPSCVAPTPSYDLSGGPFVLHSVSASTIVLDKNPHYWGTKPALTTITIKIAQNSAQLAHWLATGVVEVALPDGFSGSFLSAATKPNLNTQLTLSATLLQLEFSTATSLTQSVAVRDGLAHFIDRSKVLNQVAGWSEATLAVAQSHFFAQSDKDYPGPPPLPSVVTGQATYKPSPTAAPVPTPPFPTTADVVTAAHTLESVGDNQRRTGAWETNTGATLRLRFAINESDPWAAVSANVIATQWRAQGITVTVIPVKTATQAGVDLTNGVANVALLALHTSPYPSQAIAWFTPLLGAGGTDGSQDWSGLNNATISSLLVAASQELNPVNAEPLYTSADSDLWATMPSLPLFAEPSVTSWLGSLSGVVPNTFGPGLMWNVSLWAHRAPATSVKSP
jgi:peptide/nickel transport system substrate-binding protein